MCRASNFFSHSSLPTSQNPDQRKQDPAKDSSCDQGVRVLGGRRRVVQVADGGRQLLAGSNCKLQLGSLLFKQMSDLSGRFFPATAVAASNQ